MVDLKPKSPCAGLLPLTVGSVTLEEVDAGTLTSLSPMGKAVDLSAALEAAHGMTLPEPNRSTRSEEARCVWFGRGEALLMGPVPHVGLGDHAAVVDVSDGWAVVSLSGPDAVDVLARLVPVDLRARAFGEGQTVRTQVLHMSASITRTGEESFLVLVFRSMAQTLVHDLNQAMESVAARS